MDIEGMDFVNSVEKIGKICKIDIQRSNGRELTQKEIDEKKHKESLENALITAHNFYRKLFGYSKAPQAYLEKRGFNEETLLKFEIGFASNDWAKFIDHATNYHSKTNLEQASLISKNTEGKYFDRYRNRILFPIHNHIGKLTGFAGRAIDPKEKIKYINPANGLLYQKSQVIFGLYQATKAIKKHNEIYVVEGYTDVLRFHQLGVSNVVSLSGTKLSQAQIILLKKYSKNITLCLDNDSAGQKAIIDNIDKLIKEDIERLSK
ncbi:DNA primase-like [Sycon ciliatum]|uniref:DNA primase-like n=1 Tax=Sycon ciliatum TaxID=27933 RepID=UPI0031F66731